MSRSEGFWESSETNQSPGNGPFGVAADIWDSLDEKRQQFRHAADCRLEA